jgi:SAM-dependent methyltransferase
MLGRLKLWMGRLKARRSDLSRAWMDPALAREQRQIVDAQLQAMHAGNVAGHFSALAEIFEKIADSSDAGPQPLTVLDAGCASGYYSEVLAHLVPIPTKYCGSDFNPAMLDLAREKYPDVPLARMDIRSLGWRDGAFDVVISGAVIVHVREWRKAVAELARAAGKWLILHRTLVCFERQSFVAVQRAYNVEVYRVHIQEAELVSLLQGLGFDLISRADPREGGLEKDQGNCTYLFQRRGEPPRE